MGRPPGAKSKSKVKGVARLTAALRRLPANASPEARAMAAEALQAIRNVLRGGWRVRYSGARLQAAAILLEEACGPHRQSSAVELSGQVSLSALVPRVGDRRPALEEHPALDGRDPSVAELVPRRPAVEPAVGELEDLAFGGE